jgi:hypothetical protein
MMYVMILVCSLPVSSADCAETNAIRFEKLPGAVSTPWQCWNKAQIYAAEHVKIEEGQYMIVHCSASYFGFPT